MKKIFLVCTILFTVLSPLFSQVQLTQYFLDETIFNPAFAGSKDAFCVGTYFRDQWLGMKDDVGNDVSPKTAVFNLHATISELNSGLGLNILYDRAGFEETSNFKLNYSYFPTLKNGKNKLGIGLGFSVLHKSIDFRYLSMAQANDPLIPDAVVHSDIVPDLDLGLFYQNEKNYYFGISATNLLESTATIGNIAYKQKRYLYTTGGYNLYIISEGNNKLTLVPTFLFKTNLVNCQAEVNTRVEFNKKYWAGISWRYQDALAAVGGIYYKGFRIGASYDLTTGRLSGHSNGSLEFFVGFCAPILKIKTQNFNTRYL